MRIRKLTVRNFCSFGENGCDLDLPSGSLVVIGGLNEDAPAIGDRRNGSGKTALVHAVYYALFGDIPVVGLRPSQMVNAVNGEGLRVFLAAEWNGTRIEIERGRRPDILAWRTLDSGSDRVREVGGGGRLTDDQARFEKAAGIDRDLFDTVAVVHPWRPSPFVTSSADRRTFVERLLDLGDLVEAAESIRKRLSGVRSDAKTAEAVVEALRRTMERRLRRAEEETERRRARLAEIESRLSGLEALDLDEERKRHVENAELSRLLEERNAVDLEAIRLVEEVERLEETMSSLRSRRRSAELSRCPSCGALLDTDVDLDAIDRRISDTEKKIAALREEAGKCAVRLARLDERIAKTADGGRPWRVATSGPEELDGLDVLVRRLREERDRLREEISGRKDEDEESELEEAERNARRLDVDRRALELLRNLVQKDDSPVRRRILRARLKAVTERLDRWLDRLGFEGSVHVTDGFSVEIGDVAASGYTTLSRGERIRLDMAWILSCHEYAVESGRIPPLLLMDEILDSGLDSDGVTRAFGVLDAYARESGATVLLATNREELLDAARVLVTVRRSGGFSEASLVRCEVDGSDAS